MKKKHVKGEFQVSWPHLFLTKILIKLATRFSIYPTWNSSQQESFKRTFESHISLFQVNFSSSYYWDTWIFFKSISTTATTNAYFGKYLYLRYHNVSKPLCILSTYLVIEIYSQYAKRKRKKQWIPEQFVS